MVRFYRDLIDAYVAFPKDGSFDLTPWQARLAGIQSGRDTARAEGTRRLLIEAREPVLAP
jgi:hypothetical protein